MYQQRKSEFRKFVGPSVRTQCLGLLLFKTLLLSELVLVHLYLGFRGSLSLAVTKVYNHRTRATNAKGLLVTELKDKE